MMPLLKRLLIPLAALVAVCALAAPSAFASTNQITIVQDNNALNKNPAATLKTLEELGVKEVKYAVYWSQYAVHPGATSVPAADTTPQAYQNYDQFGLIDEIDQDATADGIKLGLMVTAPAPRWAEGTANCSPGNISAAGNADCRPSAADYENFVKALGSRYSGSFTLPNGTVLPKVSWWSVWNEPNYSPNIAPQLIGSTTYEGADLYRGLVDAAWSGLQSTGHAHDTFLLGEVAPRGISGSATANVAGIKPVQFLAAVYCELSSGRRMTGRVARANGCPASAATFRAENPALFDASGIADHPYSQGVAPNIPTYDCDKVVRGQRIGFCQNPQTKQNDSQWTELASISHLESGIDADLRAYGSHTRYPIWSTEYGYWTHPSGNFDCGGSLTSDCDLPAATAAAYLNEAEFISYENPRIVSFDQYQLYEPTTGAWTDGLLTARGAALPTFDAWEVPLWMPTTSLSHPSTVVVWGGARPATFFKQPDVEVQFKGKSGGWKTIATEKLSADGYFVAHVKFSASGSVRLAYPTGTVTLVGRTQAITVR